MTLPFSIFIRGIPQPKGSKKAFTNPRTLRPIIVDDNKKTMRQWESDVRRAVQEAWQGPPLEGPVSLNVCFVFLRPKSAPKRNPPVFKATTPDYDKLARIVGDACEGIAFRNDAQIARAIIEKRYGDEAGLLLELCPI